jgi:hypothetical protein
MAPQAIRRDCAPPPDDPCGDATSKPACRVVGLDETVGAVDGVCFLSGGISMAGLLSRLVVVATGMAAATVASADPELALAPGAGIAPGAPVPVIASDLDAGTVYWVTIVPTGSAAGDYGEFHYVEGAARAEISFDSLPAGGYEVRLHAQGGGDPMVARLALDISAGDGAPRGDVSAATRAFAAAYGLNGDWRGAYVCPDGAADVSLTLWTSYGDGAYDGRLRVALRDGPDAGASGEWTVSAAFSERGRSVGLTPTGAVSEPRTGYGMTQMLEATLSDDGARIDGGTFYRHGCTDFALARVPVPEPTDAAPEAEAGARAGFWGEWSGAYACGGVETALDLGFSVNPVTGQLGARWRYRGGEGRRAFSGEIAHRVVPGPAGAAALYPVRWIEQPRGHVALPASLRVAPDGRRMQGEVEGCGRLSVARVGGPPAPPDAAALLLSDAARTGLAAMEGAWEGDALCDGATVLARLDLSGLDGGSPEGMFQYVAAGGIDTVTKLRLALTPGADGGLTADVAERLSYKMHGPVHAPVAIAPGDNAVALRFADAACAPASLARALAPAPLAILREADAPPGTVFTASADGGALSPAPPAQACEALGAWVAALAPEDSVVERAGRRVLDWAGWPALFADARFEPVFGARYATLAGTPAAGRHLVALVDRNCRDPRVTGARDLTKVLTAAFGLDRSIDFGTDHHAFRSAALRAAAAAGALPEMLAAVEAIPLDRAGGPALAALRMTFAPRLVALAPPDRRTVEEALEVRGAAVARAVEDDRLARLASGDTRATLALMLEAEAALAGRAPAEIAEWRARLAPHVAALASGALGPEASEETRGRFAPLAVYLSVADRLAALDRGDAAAAAGRLAALVERIGAATSVAALRAPLGEALALQKEDEGAAARALAAIDRRAQTLVTEVAARLPEPPPAPQPLGAAPPGVKEAALVGALLSGDRETAYRADRGRGLVYLQRMTAVFREYCPAALPSDIQTVFAAQRMNLDALAAGGDAMAAEGLRMMAETIVDIYSGQVVRDAIRTEEIFLAADGDAQILLATFGCPSGATQTFFTNARDWVAKPAEGVAAARLRMADMCMAAVDDGLRMRQTVEYCACAGGVLDQALSAEAKKYLRDDPRSRYRDLPIIARHANARIQSCRQ